MLGYEWQSQTPSIDLYSALAGFMVVIGMGTSKLNRSDGRIGGLELDMSRTLLDKVLCWDNIIKKMQIANSLRTQ